ncbi:MAG: metal ABC transporter substrate-binding protein [Sphaerochaetaceae bacterium]|nr:metal ABC transporter substrate-binding protein [Sphaerochaetaceae bacterium]
MKKYLHFVVLALVLLAVIAFVSCTKGSERGEKTKLSVVCTVFPPYDWTREIIKGCEDRIELTILNTAGTDLHSYQPSANDIRKINESDLFIFVGGESDEWARSAAESTGKTKDQIIILIEELGNRALKEEHVEGMEEHEHEEEEEEEEELDEHVWLSLRNASFLTSVISQRLSEKDPENREKYLSNAENYRKELNELDNKYVKTVEDSKSGVLIFGDRFPFRYLVNDYSLKYYAAFSGCSAETEASFKTIIFLASKVNEYGCSCVLTLEHSDPKIAKTIIENTQTADQKILVLNSLQSVTGEDIKQGLTYTGVMTENLDVIKEALN